MIKNMICTVCPMGCELSVELSDDAKVLSVSGNTCKRGEAYAVSEATSPVRTLTTTALCEDGTPVSVRTSAPIPKDKMFECMELINSVTVKLPVSVGDVIIANAYGTNVIATQNKEVKSK